MIGLKVMSKKMSVEDFRAVRVVLEPEDFALGSENPDTLPSDLIEEATWRSITVLPDDVSIRTTDRNGTILSEVEALSLAWISATGNGTDKLFDPMFDAGDDLRVSVFNAVHGFYRCAFSCLRNVVELMVIGTHSATASNSPDLYKKWREGRIELKFGDVCTQLSKTVTLQSLHNQLQTVTQDSLFASTRDSNGRPEGWSRRIYHHLCNYAHTRPGFAEADLWHSNGPIYVPKAFWNWYKSYLETTSLAAVLVLIARPKGEQKLALDLFTDDVSINPPIANAAMRILSGAP